MNITTGMKHCWIVPTNLLRGNSYMKVICAYVEMKCVKIVKRHSSISPFIVFLLVLCESL